MDYDPSRYPPFAVTVDIVLFNVSDAFEVLLIERGIEPFKGSMALPGGFVQEETLDQAALRELEEETGVSKVDLEPFHLEQLATYGDPDRDPRMRVVSAAYMALISRRLDVGPGTDAAEARWVPVDEALEASLAFDHDRILEDAVERARSKLEYTTLATKLAGDEFTLGELQDVYEKVWGQELQRANFRRKVLSTEGFVEPTGRRAVGRLGGAPADVFRGGPGAMLNPQMVRG